MLLYKVASFVVIDFENGVDYISFSVFDFSALKNGTEYSFVNDQFQVNDYTDVTFIKDKSGTAYTEATLDAFIATIKVIDDPNIGNLPAGGTTGQILAKIDGTDYNAEWIDNLLDEVNPVCKLGENISKGQAVYISGADGTNKIIKKASNDTELTSSKTFGLLSASGVTNDKIRVITTGYLSGLNTSSANEGDPVWLGVNGNLIYGIANKPHAPEHLVFIGFVVRKNNVNGQIYVRVQNGFELDELHDVKIQSPANKNTIFYNSSNSLWENRLIGIADVTDLESALSGKEPTINAGTTSQYWRGDKSWQTLNKSAVGLGNIDNTSDLNKPISTATQTALNAKQDSATAINTSNIGAQSVAYAASAGNADTLDGYHASAFQMVLTNPVTGTGTTNYVSKFGSSSTIENSQIYDNGFQVGVGLTNPSSRFHVNGLSILTNPSGDNYNENLRLPQTSNGYSSIAMGGPVATLGTSVQQWTLVKHPTNNFSIRHYNTDHLFINTDGNVGLGTSAFVYPASGRKVFAINGSTQALLEFQNGGFINGYIYVSSTLYEQSSAYAPQTFLTSNNERMRITEGGRIGIGTTNPETILHLNGNITVPFTHTYNVEGSYTRKAIFYTGWNNNGDSKDFLTIQAAGNSDSKVCFPSGNVAIGTNDPRSRLSVQNGEISINNLPDGYSTPMAVIGAFNNDAQNGGLILKTATGNSLTEKMRITSVGNIGIGTTNPNYTLDVNGFINATRIYPASSNNTYITGDGNAGMAVVGSGYFYVSAVGGSYFQKEVRFRNTISNDTGAYLQINGGTTGVTYFAGTIGVGGSNVYHGSSIQVGNGIFYAQGNASDIGGKIYGYWDTGFQPYAGGLKFQVFRNQTGSYQMYDAMTLSGNGNVGIGTISPDPSAILHLESTTQGFLPPRMSDSEMNSISSPVAGLMVWNNDSVSLFVFDGASWRKIAYA